MAEQHYEPVPNLFNSKGLSAFAVRDACPENSYLNLEGFEVRQEGALSSRLGRVAITTDGTNNFPLTFSNPPNTDRAIINTLGRLKLTAGNTARYAGGHDPLLPFNPAQIWRRISDTGGAYTVLGDPPGLSLGYSSSTMSMVTYRPSFSGTPYIYFADKQRMVKDDGGSANVSWWGVLPPCGFVIATVQPAISLTLTAVGNSIGGVAIYTGTITGGAGNALAGFQFKVSGFSIVGNNGVFVATASTATTLTLQNGAAIVEAAAAIALQQGPDVTGNGNNYDYRLTLYNQNTGDESNPTAVFPAGSTVAPINQPVLITWPATSFQYQDTQATHFRIYRRGGTLTGTIIQGTSGFNGWLQIGQVPVSATFFLDTFPDYQIANNQVLSIDNDPPCTVALSSQYNSTLQTAVVGNGGLQTVTANEPIPNGFNFRQVVIVDTGANQEIILVVTPLSTIPHFRSFKAYFQLNHVAGTPIIVNTLPEQGMNLAAMAFEQAFLAGDPINPNRLYYSKVQQPSAFSPANYIEIGVPSDPIMAVVGIRGQIFVFTQSRIYRVLNVGSGTPDPIPTASRHGLYANFAWAISEEGIYFLSFDGVYLFSADDSIPVSVGIEWLLADKEQNLGPCDPINSSLRSSAIAAYCKGEFFLGYIGVSGSKRRLIYDVVHKRWRNDSVACDAMFFEEDTAELVISESGDGMIYKDRRSDWDQEGFVSGVRQFNPIPLNLMTPSYNQGAPRNDKIYNEFMIDVDAGGTALTITLLFDNGATPVVLGTVNNVGRQQITFPINSGNGQLSKNVALQITGSVSPTVSPAHLYQWHIKAAVDAEQRKSFDTYWSKMGTDEFKFVKQGYFEYTALDAAGIAFNVYLEGQAVPTYSFSLPQSLVRTSVKVRFPAWKGKLWRFVGISASDYKLYGESFLEFKPACNDKSYAKMPFGQVTAQGGV